MPPARTPPTQLFAHMHLFLQQMKVLIQACEDLEIAIEETVSS
jgi:hypothetical protein